MNKYPVNNVYYTIQGEGLQTGLPAVFLRLHGCNVGCPFCDTKETWEMDSKQAVDNIEAAGLEPSAYSWQSAESIAAYIQQQWPEAPWVVITGGEPALYPLAELVECLHGLDKSVAIETSGTADGHVNAAFDWVTVSPKIKMPGNLAISAAAVAVADEIKHVVGREQDIQQLDEFLAEYSLKPNAKICLQPMSQSQRATDLAVKVVKERGWRLSVQTHKYIDLP
jgi:7-carboxy-7-deazaguanine synthase